MEKSAGFNAVQRRLSERWASRHQVDARWLSDLSGTDHQSLTIAFDRWRNEFAQIGMLEPIIGDPAHIPGAKALYRTLRRTQPASTLVLTVTGSFAPAVTAAALIDCGGNRSVVCALVRRSAGALEFPATFNFEPMLEPLDAVTLKNVDDISPFMNLGRRIDCVVLTDGVERVNESLRLELLWSLLSPGGSIVNCAISKDWIRFGRQKGASKRARMHDAGVSTLRKPALVVSD